MVIKAVSVGRNWRSEILGMLLIIVATLPGFAAEKTDTQGNEPYLYQVAYQLDSSDYSPTDNPSSGVWGLVAVGGAALLILHSLSSDDDSDSSVEAPGVDSPTAGTLGVNSGAASSSSGSSSTKGRLFEIVPQNGLFFSVGGTKLDLKGDSQSSGSSSERKFTFGYDRRFNNKITAGALLDRAETEIELNGLSNAQDTNRLSAFAFLSYQLSAQTTFYSYLGLDSFEKDLSRSAGIDAQTILGATDGSGYSLGLSLAHNLPIYKGILPSALVELDYASATFDGYRETGLPADLLIFPEQENESLTVSLGGSLSKSISLSNGVLVPGFTVKVINELESEGEEFFVEPVFEGASSTVNTSDSDELHAQFSGSLNFVLRNGVQVFANYDKVFLHELFDRDRFTLGARMEY